MYRLVFLNGANKGKRLMIQQGSVLIGRDSGCTIDLADDDEVSRQHAVIEQQGRKVVIRDLGATNPVLVNDVAIVEHRLTDGDRIEIGRTVIEFQAGTGKSPPPHRRRFSKMQATAFLAISLIVLLQLSFVILFPIWQKNETVPVEESSKFWRDPGEKKVQKELKALARSKALDRPSKKVQVEEPPVSAEPGMGPEEAFPGAPVERVAEPVEAAPASMAEQSVQPPPPVEESAPEAAPLEEEAPVLDQDNGPPPPATTSVALDPLVLKAHEMLEEARKEIQAMNYAQADSLLERAQMLAPDYVPVWKERAFLLEKRGMLKKAGEQWQEIMKLTAATPAYANAASERLRVARLEMGAVPAPVTPRIEDPLPASRLARRIRIDGVDRERFQASDEYDEMRLVRIALRPRIAQRAISAEEVKVVVEFYDYIEFTGRTVPTRVMTPADGLQLSGPWLAGEVRNVTAVYMVPRGFRAEERSQLGERRDYEGYRVSVYYGGELQDEEAMPRSLLKMPPPDPGSSP